MEHRTLVISGASKGIGRATAAKYCGLGHRVVNLSRTPLEYESVINIQADMSDPRWLEACKTDLLENGLFQPRL